MPLEPEDVVMVPRRAPRVQTAAWICFFAAIALVATGWFLVVGKRLTAAASGAKDGFETVAEAAAQFRTGTDPSRAALGDAASALVEQVRPALEGVQQRQDAVDLLSAAMADRLENGPEQPTQEETPIDTYAEEDTRQAE